MTIKDAFQFGIEPVRITDTDNIQVNEGLPTNADPQVYALQLTAARTASVCAASMPNQSAAFRSRFRRATSDNVATSWS